jgi:hypothetical protein
MLSRWDWLIELAAAVAAALLVLLLIYFAIPLTPSPPPEPPQGTVRSWRAPPWPTVPAPSR